MAAKKQNGNRDEDVEMKSAESDSDQGSEASSDSSTSDAESDAGSSSSSSAASEGSKTSINPDGIPSFPLPQAPAKPSQTLLSRQGLPSALRDAVLISEDDKVKIDDIQLVTRRKRSAEGEQLGDRIKERLRHLGIEEFFAVQTALIPQLASLPLVPFKGEVLNDFLVSAPTGSGKTLAYGVPVVEVLGRRIVTRLRALIILPTRDLVMQVRETMEELARGSGLKVRNRPSRVYRLVGLRVIDRVRTRF